MSSRTRRLPFPERFGGAALVTGASSGIGAAFARALAAGGMDLVLVARRAQRLSDLAARIGDAGTEVHTIVQDLTEPGSERRVLEATREAGVDVGLLVSNAGFGHFGLFHEQQPSHAARMVDLNCRATVALTHAFLPGMIGRGRGGIIITASLAGFQPTPFVATYAATKAFDLVFAESLWAELRPLGIDVLALCPGYTPTEFQQKAGTNRLRVRGSPTTAEEVVQASLGALGRKPSVIPGTTNKVMSVPGRILPHGPLMSLAYRFIDATRRPER